MTPRKVRERLSEIVAPVSGVPQMSAAYVDEAFLTVMKDAAMKCKPPWLRKTTLDDLVADQSEYLWPQDMLIPLRVRSYQEGSTTPPGMGYLRKATEEEIDELAFDWDGADPSGALVNGGPGLYFESGIVSDENDADYGRRKFKLYPAPRSEREDGLLIRYLRKPAYPTETKEIIDIPDQFHLAMCYRVAWLYLTRQGSKAVKDFAAYDQIWREAVDQMQHLFTEERQPDYNAALSVGGWGAGVDAPSTFH